MTDETTVDEAGRAAPQDDPTPGGAALRLVPPRGTAPDENDPTSRTGSAQPVRAVPDVGRSPAGRRRRRRLRRTVLAWHERGRRSRAGLAEAGMATAEYAIATLAAVGFAGLLVVILKGNEVKGLLLGIIRQALSL